MSICRNPKCTGYCAECPKVSIASDSRHVVTDGRTHYDLDAELRLRELERDVVEKAKAYEQLHVKLIAEGASERYPSRVFDDLCVELDVAANNLCASVRALTAAEGA